MAEGTFYSVTTRRFTLRCGQEKWLWLTHDLYNQILLFYYLLFLDLEEERGLSELPGRRILRELELLTIKGRDRRPVPFPLPWDKVPLYFRRAAINNAVAAARALLGRRKKAAGAGRESGLLKRAESFHEAPTFYKGMYLGLKEGEVELKVWNGRSWSWIH